jgi:hypothetical protein
MVACVAVDLPHLSFELKCSPGPARAPTTTVPLPAKLKALLLSRARADIDFLPQFRASLRSTAVNARRARFGINLFGWGAAAAQLVRRQVLLNELQAARMAAAGAGDSGLALPDVGEGHSAQRQQQQQQQQQQW